MKRYINPIPNGGAPLHNNRLNIELQAEIWDALSNILRPLGYNYPNGNFGTIIGGCEITANGGGFDIAEGLVYLNGSFLRVTAATGQAFTKYIAAAAPVNIAKTFADSVSRDLIVESTAELVGSAPGSGQYITISDLYSALGNRLIEVHENVICKTVLSGSGGGTTDLLTFPAIATGKTAGYEVDFISEYVSGAGGSAGHGSHYKILAFYKNIGGTVSIWGAAVNLIQITSGASSPTFQLGVTGASVKAQYSLSSGEVHKIKVRVKKVEI